MASKVPEESKPAAAKVEESVDSSAAATEAPSTAATPAVPSPSVEPASSEAASAGGAKTEGAKSRRVYVGNLAWDVSWQDLKDLMKTTGFEVTRSDIMKFSDGRSKGYGIVEFATVEGAQHAVLTLNDKPLKGRPIFVREDREARGGQGFSSGEQAQGRRVYVGNLSWDVNWNILKDHMRQAGEVVHAEVMCEPSGRSKGCGVVEYATEQDAQTAISTLTHSELNGRTIFVREDRETSSASGPKTGPPPPGRTSQNSGVYVWNLSYDTSWQDLKDHMRKAGNVDQATILTTDGNSAGIGVVYYQKPSEAARAIRELQDTVLKGRQIKLREDRAPAGGRGGRGRGRGPPRSQGGAGRGGAHHSASATPSGTQLYVGNLAGETNWRDLKDLFKQCGEVDRAEVRQGFGTVRFAKKEDAQAAIEKLNGAKLHDRTLEVRLDDRN
eukprot:CAMPEP_0170343062 /NCGR_PEP_ID=MMETSP0116_2-20130129/72700_1 /TAXON_ID=400756 /ORGANISM="Durinskia baltica, Strain CSIRO CS-38" /LENGTH=440 /DNA_ID=CAMNT_0010596703 /DNA_START=55 /DNA_END=1377 /DNA_ORIENTATION=-